MEMKTVTVIPSGKAVIGGREIQKAAKAGEIKRIIVAKNCPDWLLEKLLKTEGHPEFGRFSGDERELGTALGKAFAIAAAGFKE